jgi:hypothetical protein
VLHAVLEETERAFVKVEQYTYTVTLLDFACCIIVVFAVAAEAAFTRPDEPAVSTIIKSAVVIGVKVRLGNAEKTITAQLLHLPIVLARR